MGRPRTSFRRRILWGLAGYALALTVAVVAHGYYFNEQAEQLVWQTLLDTELDHIVERSRSDPDYRWIARDGIVLYDDREADAVPSALRALPPGVHDDFVIDGTEHVILVREMDGRKWILALDIDALEQREFDTGLTVLCSAIGMIVLLGLALAWGTERLVRPLTRLATRIAALRPDQPGQQLEIPGTAHSELMIIAEALNDYLYRNDRFVERERVFIDTASHELRTPIAVIVGASEIALQQEQIPPVVRGQLARIRRTARDVEQLISLLLVLAKDPARLSRVNDTVALDQLLQEIVEDHRHLTREKDLALTLAVLPKIEILPPLSIVQAAIGNLLRNAIENSDRGNIVVSLHTPATVVIEDPGHGMTPEEISMIYARLARGGGDRGGSGIGLDLISRLCEHLGWHLELRSGDGQGTTTILTFNS
jgi:signal transduction histidine kinase